jgi:magnesium-transporting ATPase (P-type)
MYTFTALANLICIILIYQYIKSSHGTVNIFANWKILKDLIILLLCAFVALFISHAIIVDLYYNNDENFITLLSTDILQKQSALTSLLWLSMINAYKVFVMTNYNDIITQPKPTLEIKNSRLKNKNIWTVLLSLVTFIILSIGEGLFQDIFYHPFLKPFLCKYFNIAC